MIGIKSLDMIDQPKASLTKIVYKPHGRLDSETYDNHRKELLSIVYTVPDVLILDMQDVRFVDSRGLGLLITTLKIVKSNNGRLVLHSLTDQVDMLLKLTGTNKLFEIQSAGML